MDDRRARAIDSVLAALNEACGINCYLAPFWELAPKVAGLDAAARTRLLPICNEALKVPRFRIHPLDGFCVALGKGCIRGTGKRHGGRDGLARQLCGMPRNYFRLVSNVNAVSTRSSPQPGASEHVVIS